MSRLEVELAANAAASRASFHATIAFGLLALAMLFLAGLGGWLLGLVGRQAMVMAIVAAALAYVAQFLYTAGQDRAGMAAQVACLLAAVLAFAPLALGG